MVLVRPLRWSSTADNGTITLGRSPRCRKAKPQEPPWPEMTGEHLALYRIPQKGVQNPLWIIPAEKIWRARILKRLRKSQSNPRVTVKARWIKSNSHRSWRPSANLDAPLAQILKESFLLKGNLQINPSDNTYLWPKPLEFYKYNPGDFLNFKSSPKVCKYAY